MSAEIIMFVPRPNPNRPSNEALAAEILMMAMADKLSIGILYQDTAPAEYAAPLDDPA